MQALNREVSGMYILYGSSCCGENAWNALLKSKISAGFAVQKYHSLLTQGLAANGVTVKCFSPLPVNRNISKKLFVSEKDEDQNGVSFHYISAVNFSILRRLSIFLSSFFGVLKAKKYNDTFVICDCLNIANAYGMMLAAKIKRIPVITIVTDIPDMMYGGIIRKIANGFFKSVDGFILLTDAMNSKVNANAKPNVVLEGHVDASLVPLDVNEKAEAKDGIRQIVYAGSINEIYGIKNLVDGFILASLDNCELIIYGNGDYAEELRKISEKYPSVKYAGVKENSEIVKVEQAAALLVNPRPTASEYTKYSFPSKNMEYMVSGTPLLTTKLPGMPEEYYPYIYLLNDETPMGISDTLRDIFSITADKRNEKGTKARDFVITNKSNIKQAEKIIEFLKEVSICQENF